MVCLYMVQSLRAIGPDAVELESKFCDLALVAPQLGQDQLLQASTISQQHPRVQWL
jgi:hypothetical protein